MLQKEVKKLKITAENINSILVKSNTVIKKRKKKRAELEKIIDARSVRRDKESNIERKSAKGGAFKSSLNSIKNTIISGPMDVMEKVIQFGSMILLGGMFQNIPELLSQGKKALSKLGEWGQGIKNFFTGAWESVSGFVEAIGDNETVQKILKGAGDMFNVIKEKLSPLAAMFKELWDIVYNGPLKGIVNFVKGEGDMFNEQGQLDPITHAGRHDGALNTAGTGPERLSDTFAFAENDDIEALIKEWKSLYYLDEKGVVRHKHSGKKAIGARFMGFGTGIEFEDIKKMLDRTRFPNLQSSIKNVDLIGNSSVWAGNTKTVYMPQRIIVTG